MKAQLFTAIRRNQVNEVENLLKLGADVDAVDENLETPLMKAVLNESIAIVRVLVKYNPQLNCVNNLGLTVEKLLLDSPQAEVFRSLIYPSNEEQADDKTSEKLLLHIEKIQEEKQQLETKYMYLVQQSKTELVKKSSDFKETLKTQALSRLLKGGIRDCFTISQKIEENLLQRPPGNSETVISALNQVVPAIEKQFHIDGLTAGMQLVSIFSSVYNFFSKRQEKIEAARFTKVFGNDYKQIDDNVLDDVINATIKRYYHQLHQLTLSTSFSTEQIERPDPRPSDGVYVFATAIINRIVSSIIRGRNEFYPTALFSNQEKISMPIIQRCIKALYEENWSKEMNNKILKVEKEVSDPWTVEGVLDRTGIKVITTDQTLYYTHSNITKQAKYGFCIGGQQEVTDRDFWLIDPPDRIVDTASVTSNLSQRFIGQNKNNYVPLPETDIKSEKEECCCRCIIA